MDVVDLYKEGQISQYHLQTYLLFKIDELGESYFKNALESVLLEEVPPIGDHAFAYYAGRLSIWRDVKAAIIGVNNLLEGKNYDGSSKRDPTIG